ncbi:unnamed protein product [Pleuronectes platessa]|uniref:Uncharacterized protein n=1 Tax=Pleuronectes platessa TaxID=8262 RepID=A0A9N7YQF5_PLEPL|nr:unnamed protein product [Pleuronectes platessa]
MAERKACTVAHLVCPRLEKKKKKKKRPSPDSASRPRHRMDVPPPPSSTPVHRDHTTWFIPRHSLSLSICELGRESVRRSNPNRPQPCATAPRTLISVKKGPPMSRREDVPPGGRRDTDLSGS